ncbi:LacI family DNA-binding transcriptional regulator [Pontiellaceae bacterium B12219]|nr:LacI family DNA-binding transcriptional regulator [Pontiellaceae bacterium B12219]
MTKTKKRISQSQIAKELGVSQSLVSLVLNGRRENVSDESYNRIWTLADEKGYIPRGMQPNLAPDVRSSYVGVILRTGLRLANLSNTFSHVHQGLFTVLQQSHISTTFLGGEGDLDEKMLYELLRRRDPLLGIVVYGEVKEPFLRALGALGVEVLSVYANMPGLCHSVLPNEKQSLEQLVDHLTKLGHTRFAFLGGNAKLGRNHARLSALRESLAARNLSLDERNVLNVSNGDRQEGFDCAAELVQRTAGREAPTAWVCYNGLMARGALQFALLRGIRIPQDISLVTIDRTRACEEIHPYMTSAGSDPQVIGEEAAKLLCRSGGGARSVDKIYTDLVVPSTFDAGETSGPCSA